MSSNTFLFESDFSVENKDLGGKKFDRVSRFQLESMNKDVVMVIDIATALYPLKLNDRVSVSICRSVTFAFCFLCCFLTFIREILCFRNVFSEWMWIFLQLEGALT